jgi:tetratricopeptide (TPR) repeat protein
LNDYDVSFAWRIVIFLIYPLLNLLALWSSSVACQWFGGYVKSLSYGLLWYQVVPGELASPSYLIPVLFSGEIAQTLLILLSLPALFFRPHPFFAMLLIYTCAFVMGINLIADPILSIFGFGSMHWQIAIACSSKAELVVLAMVHFLLAVIYLTVLKNQTFQMVFARLIRPIAVEKLQQALAERKAENKDGSSVVSLSELTMRYEAAGFHRQAAKELRNIKKRYGQEISVIFMEAYLSYRQHKYQRACNFFIAAGDACPPASNDLKGMFLGAAACCAHANRQYETALNLVGRALEFDHNCAIARMIKMDILLRQGKEKKAAEELKTVLWTGGNLNLEQSIPIDWQRAFKLLREEEASKFLSTIGNKVKN